MSRDWTPKEWDIVHQQDPGLREHFNNFVYVDPDGLQKNGILYINKILV